VAQCPPMPETSLMPRNEPYDKEVTPPLMSQTQPHDKEAMPPPMSKTESHD
jgi:hypothetical protein